MGQNSWKARLADADDTSGTSPTEDALKFGIPVVLQKTFVDSSGFPVH